MTAGVEGLNGGRVGGRPGVSVGFGTGVGVSVGVGVAVTAAPARDAIPMQPGKQFLL